jgi:hypothetical protein
MHRGQGYFPLYPFDTGPFACELVARCNKQPLNNRFNLLKNPLKTHCVHFTFGAGFLSRSPTASARSADLACNARGDAGLEQLAPKLKCTELIFSY